ncbi:MAG: hypothetical protein V4660_01165 [Pseudomonadota bacterium]
MSKLKPTLAQTVKTVASSITGVGINRSSLSRKVVFKGKYQVSSDSGGFKRDSKLFIDPTSTISILKAELSNRGHGFILQARESFKRKGMGPLITESMMARAKGLAKAEHTPESARIMKFFPAENLQALGVERNHINANGQVATQLAALLSKALSASGALRTAVSNAYKDYVEAHGLEKQDVVSLKKSFDDYVTRIESSKNARDAVSFLVKHTTAIADQSENLRFGPGQGKPRPSLKIVTKNLPDVRSNQDVYSHWDGNRTPNGSDTPRSHEIRLAILKLESQTMIPKGMGAAATTRPILKSTNVAFGSLKQTG